MKDLFVDAESGELGRVMNFIYQNMEGRGFSPQEMMEVQLAAEEVFVNICAHAYTSPGGMVAVRLEVTGTPATARVLFMDCGIPYNPLEKEIPNGHMIRTCMDSMEYEHTDGENRLTVTKTAGGEKR